MAQPVKYIPAMGFFSLANLYDPLIKIGLRETKFKTRLIHQSNIQPSDHVLDLGCGTATLTLMIRSIFTQVRLVGLDGDRRILTVANKKIGNLGLDIQLDEAFSFQMPSPNGFFDRVVSSLVLHHLSDEAQCSTLQEAIRVLKPGGELHIADFASPHGQRAHLTSHILGGVRPIIAEARLPLLESMSDAGFTSVKDWGRFFTFFGKIGFFSGAKPEQAT